MRGVLKGRTMRSKAQIEALIRGAMSGLADLTLSNALPLSCVAGGDGQLKRRVSHFWLR